MTRDEAKHLLIMHSFMYENIEHPKMTNGFLGSLRPYQGLREENFHEIIGALRVLAPELSQEKVDTKIISALCSTLSISGGITHRIHQTIENSGGN